MKEKKCKKCGRKLSMDNPSKYCEACNNKRADAGKVILPMIGVAILGIFAPGLASKMNPKK